MVAAATAGRPVSAAAVSPRPGISTSSPCQFHRPVTGTGCTYMDSTPAAKAARMTGIDLIAVAPWVLFGAVLSAVCIRLLRPRRAEPRHWPADQVPASHRDPQDTQCSEKNSSARRR